MADQDHLELAEGAMRSGIGYVEEGEGSEEPAHLMLHLSEAHAQIAQAEQLKRLADLFDGTTDAPGLIGVTGSISTQHV